MWYVCLGERVRNLGPHAANRLMVLDGNDPAGASPDGGADGGKVGRCLMRGSVRGVLKADMREHGNDRSLREGRHRQRQVSLGDAELTKRIHDGDESGLGESGAGADHVGLSDTDVNETI